MPSLTLSGIALRAHSLPKPQTFCLFPLDSLPKKPPSKPSFPISTPVFSRYLRQWCGSPFMDPFPRCVPAAPENLNVLEAGDLDTKNCQASPKSISFRDDTCVSDELPTMDNTMKDYHIADSATPYVDFVKFILLVGYLTLHDSQLAIAGTDLASGLQSIPYVGDLSDISTGFASAFLLIFFSELGDKTFFIAALLAARNSSATVFTGTFGALAVMTIISVVIGRTFHYVDEILPFRFGGADLPVDDIAAVCLLVYFGVSTLIDAASSDGQKAEDEQKEAELAVSEFSGNGGEILTAASTIISTFALVFVAEWGDKSFFSTIALAAASSPLGVIGGSLAGHGVATLIAVLGGSLLGTFLSDKAIAYIGGSLFLVFAAVTLIEIVS